MESKKNGMSPGLQKILMLGFGILGAARTIDTIQRIVLDDILPAGFWAWLHAATGPLWLIVACHMYLQLRHQDNGNTP